MAHEVRLAVTQPHHGPGGELLHDVGDLLAPGTPEVAGRLVVVEVPDKPATAPAAASPKADGKPVKGGAAS